MQPNNHACILNLLSTLAEHHLILIPSLFRGFFSIAFKHNTGMLGGGGGGGGGTSYLGHTFPTRLTAYCYIILVRCNEENVSTHVSTSIIH